MNAHSFGFALLLVSFAGAVQFGASGCRVERENPDHCFYAEGDRSCAELDPERPFCVAPSCGDAAFGCVAEQPQDPSCHSPCGGGASAEQDDGCVETAGDGDPGDGDGEPEPDLPGSCGDGALGPDEDCDDGNAVDEDGCTNACTLPACGDGILQAGAGELCDDGNSSPGDGCTASCVPPGALIWEQLLDLQDQSEDVGRRVVLTNDDAIVVLHSVDGSFRLAEYDAEGAEQWNFGAPSSERPSLAIGPGGELAVGGVIGIQGLTRLYDPEGNLQWTRNVPAADSSVLDVAIDGLGQVLAVGYHASSSALLLRYDGLGAENWSLLEDGGGALGPVIADAEGGLWAARADPPSVERYDAGTQSWSSAASELGPSVGLVADPEANLYLLASSQSAFSLSKYDPGGALLWTVEHDTAGVLESASGLALLPGGGVLVAGVRFGMPGESDALLSFYDAEGGSLIPDMLLDGEGTGDLDRFHDVAVSASGYAVAVGARQVSGSDSQLWIRKFEI
jgi:cysteine-rich repeat protein